MHPVDVETAAKNLAVANAESELSISRIYWFPAPNQIRLVEVDADSIRNDDDSVHPIYFNPIPDFPFVSGIALIHPDEVHKKHLPPEWHTDWAEGKIVFDRSGA